MTVHFVRGSNKLRRFIPNGLLSLRGLERENGAVAEGETEGKTAEVLLRLWVRIGGPLALEFFYATLHNLV